jgi:probable phosphoglycerate mutase
MPFLALLRHGPTDWTDEHRLQGRSDRPLSTEGRRAVGAWRLDSGVAGFDWLTSPLLRARETARLLGHGEAAVDPRLIEMSFGDWEGRRLQDLRAELGPSMAGLEALGLDFRAPGGETPREVQARLRPLLAEIGAGGRNRLAVTHKGVIRAVYSLATGWPLLGQPPERLAPFALHIFALDGSGGPSIHRLNLVVVADSMTEAGS